MTRPGQTCSAMARFGALVGKETLISKNLTTTQQQHNNSNNNNNVNNNNEDNPDVLGNGEAGFPWCGTKNDNNNN